MKNILKINSFCFFLFVFILIISSTMGSSITIQKKNKNIDNKEFFYYCSERNIVNKTIIIEMGNIFYSNNKDVDKNSRFYPLIATPLSIYYDDKKHVSPLLIYNKNNPSKSVSNFLDNYDSNDIFEFPRGDINNISRHIAKLFWKKSSTILVIENSDIGYEQALMAVPIASYLNIPVIIGNPCDVIEELSCKYIIVIGDVDVPDISYIKLYGREAIISYILQICKNKFNSIEYIAIANPSDSFPIKILNKTKLLDVNDIEKGINKWSISNKDYKNIDTYKFTIPEGNYIIKYHLFYDAGFNIPIDNDIYDDGFHLDFSYENKTIKLFHGNLFFTNTEAYKKNEIYYDMQINNRPGNYYIKLSSFGKKDKKWNLTLTSEGINKNNIPQVPFLSSIAPYLASCRKGIVISDRNFSKNIAGKICDLIYKGENLIPNFAAQDAAKMDCKYVKMVLNQIFNIIKNIGFYNTFLEKTPYIGIVSDTNMIPMYYGPSVTPDDCVYWEIPGQANDNYLSDIDNDGQDLNCTLELAVGRIMGRDIQDSSALIARTLFYDDIISKYDGFNNRYYFGKSSTYINGGLIGLRIKTISHIIKIKDFMRKNGVKIHSESFCFKPFDNSELILDKMSKSSFIISLGIGRYYGFYYYNDPTYSGKKITVSKIIDRNLGPSVFTGIGCTTGQTDGIDLRCTLSMGLIHAGVNSVFLDTRADNCKPFSKIFTNPSQSGWSNYDYPFCMIDFFREELFENKESLGKSVRNAKNRYVECYTNCKKWNDICNEDETEYGEALEEYLHYVLYGDPAFIPC